MIKKKIRIKKERLPRENKDKKPFRQGKQFINFNKISKRTVIGLTSIILSLFICFVLTPLFNKAVESKVEVVRIKENIKEGEHIQNSSLETVTIGGFNLPNGVILHAENVVGRYATTNMYKGDYIFTNKLSDTPITEFEYLTELDGTKQAISVTLKTFATGLSGKLESGDIVSIIASDYGEFRQTVQPSELKYVQVIAVTDKQGYDKAVNKNGNEEEKELPSTITLLVNEEQSKILAELESEGKIHVTLVYRGDNKNAEKFLKTQEEFFYKEDTFEATGKENTDIQTEENILHESEEGEGINE